MASLTTKEINKLVPEGSKFYPASRCILSEWPKMIYHERGKKGGKPAFKVCNNDGEVSKFMATEPKAPGPKPAVTEG